MAVILHEILSPSSGIVNQILGLFGVAPIHFLGSNECFQGTMVVTDIWKEFGYGTVVYLAAITSIDPELYDAAAIDGAGRLRQTWHVTLPGMREIIVLLMVLKMDGFLNAGFDQIYNLYSPAVYQTGDILDTMIYRMGLISMDRPQLPDFSNLRYLLSLSVYLIILRTSCLITGCSKEGKESGKKKNRKSKDKDQDFSVPENF